jgi:hypothetical protein
MHEPRNPEAEVSINETADVLGVSRVKVRRLILQGVLVAHENALDRREKLIKLSDVLRLARQGRPAREVRVRAREPHGMPER